MQKSHIGLGMAGLLVVFAGVTAAQTMPVRKDSTPTPYHRDARFVPTLPKGQKWGAVTGVGFNNGHLWIVERCGQNSCDGSSDDPIVELDMTGKPIKSFGAGLFVSPHVISVLSTQRKSAPRRASCCAATNGARAMPAKPWRRSLAMALTRWTWRC